MSTDTAICLGRYFRPSSACWLNLQQAHDLSTAMAARDGEYDRIAEREAG